MQDQVPIILASAPYDPSEVVLIGSNIAESGAKTEAEVRVDLDEGSSAAVGVKLSGAAEGRQIALIRAYVYEGHFYELPKAKILTVSGTPSEVPGARTVGSKKLLMWRMRRNDRVAEVTVEDGLLEALVLDANLPSKRGQGSYAANMQLAHRSGRLT